MNVPGMTMIQFFERLLSSTACAAAVFGVVLIAMETLMPGSVLPYLNPIPFVIAGIVGLSIDAAICPAATRSRWRTAMLAIVVAAIVFVFSFVGIGFDGKISIVAITFFVIGAATTILSLRRPKQEPVEKGSSNVR
jgi:hypothetical protein